MVNIEYTTALSSSGSYSYPVRDFVKVALTNTIRGQHLCSADHSRLFSVCVQACNHEHMGVSLCIYEFMSFHSSPFCQHCSEFVTL